MLLGGPQGDAVYAARGADRIYLGAGKDGIYAGADGSRDLIVCGPGFDRVWWGDGPDAADVFRGCEEFSANP